MQRKTVRNPASAAFLGVVIFGFSVFMFVMGLAADDRNVHYEGIFYGILGVASAVIVLDLFFVVKFEYDEYGFTYTDPFLRKRDIRYDEIFSLMKTAKNTLRIELKDGKEMLLSTSTRSAKEFENVLKLEYAKYSAQGLQGVMLN